MAVSADDVRTVSSSARHAVAYSRVTLMLRVWRPSVCLSMCNVGGLWLHSATKSGNRHTRSVSWLPTCRSWPGKYNIPWGL